MHGTIISTKIKVGTLWKYSIFVQKIKGKAILNNVSYLLGTNSLRFGFNTKIGIPRYAAETSREYLSISIFGQKHVCCLAQK